MENQNTQPEVVEVDLDKKLNEVALKVKSSPEVVRIADSLDTKNAQSIMTFGQETAVEISKFSDKILSSISKSSVEDSGTMLKQLNNIMDKFDKKDFEDNSGNFLEKLFNSAQKKIKKLLEKYETMDKEISKIYIEIKKYESEIVQSNQTLEEMFEKNIMYYEQLEKYVQAGKLVLERMKAHVIPELQEKAKSGEQLDQLNLQNAVQTLELVDQRIYDLELAKMVSMQTAPQIKLIQRGNYNLTRKISSAFVVTLPIFKTGLIQAISIKRQRIQAEAMKALDDKTNEMLLRNAENISTQSVDIAKLSSGSSIKIETLEQTFDTIINGIQATLDIEKENKANRETGRQKILELQEKIKSRVSQ